MKKMLHLFLPLGEKEKKWMRVMKLTSIILLVTFMQMSASVLSQGNKVTIQEKNISLEQLLWKIQRETDFVFVFSQEHVDDFNNLEVNVTGELEEILKEILEDKGLTYEKKNDAYVIKKAPPVIIEQQEEKKVTVKGFVYDRSGQPLPGAAVVLEGTNIGTATGMKGEFSLQFLASFPNPELQVTMLGFRTAYIKVDGRESYEFILTEEIEGLDEVVVTGYTKTSKVRATSAAAKVTSKSIERQVTANLDERMEGLATGLNINTVTPSGGEETMELILRGISTFDEEDISYDKAKQQINSLNRQPLIVVDGFPYEGPFNDIDMSTIESMDVLKDAAATALWGLRASNGVIVITTKRGKEGKPRVTFSTNWTFGTKPDLNDLQLASSADELHLRDNYQTMFEVESPSYRAINYFTDKGEEPWWWEMYGPGTPWVRYENDWGAKYRRLNPYEQIYARFYDGEIDEAERNRLMSELGQNDVLPQFEDQLLRNGLIVNNSINVMGGSNFINYSLTVSHMKENKPTIGDDDERLNASLSTDIKLNRKLSLINDISITSSESNRNGVGISELYSGNIISRYANLVDGNGNPAAMSDVYAPYREEFLGKGFDDIAYSPILDRNYRNNQITNNNLRIATGINYKFTSWLTGDIKYQYNRVENNIENLFPTGSYTMRYAQNGYVTEIDPGDGTGAKRAVPYGEMLEKAQTINTYSIIRGNLSFNKVFGVDHVVSGIIGMEATENKYTINQQQFVGYSDRTGIYALTFDHYQWADNGGDLGDTSYLGYGSYSAPIMYTPPVTSRTVSSFSNFGYSYKAKYNIEASLKVDQATAFGINKRLSKNLYYAVSGSWNMAKEEFISNNAEWLNVLKLRTSYGLNGNMRRGLTTRTTIKYGSRPDWTTNRNYAAINSAANPNLSPESTRTFNVGLDFALFDRITGAFDIYDKHSTDLLVRQQISTTYGLRGIYSNDGEISNKGIELSLGADFIKKQEFKWNATLNYSYNKNKVIKYGDRAETTGLYYYENVAGGNTKVIGEDISTRAFFEWGGLNENGDPTVILDGERVSYDDPEFLSATQDQMAISKPFIAPHFGGLTNTFTYKNFTLSALMTYKFGHVFQESLKPKYGLYKNSNDYMVHHKDIANAWREDNKNTDIPALVTDVDKANDRNRELAFTYSNYGLHDASYIRLKDITLNYQIDQKLTERIGVRRASLMFQVRDLGLIWKANDIDVDPESIPFGTSSMTFAGSFYTAYRPGIKVPVSFVVGAKFEF